MDNWPDSTIRSVALWYIEKHIMAPSEWLYTHVGDAPQEVLSRVELQAGEAPLVSFFLSSESWYLLSTRRIIGASAGLMVSVNSLDVVDERFGDFKGRSGVTVEVMFLRLSSGLTVELQYETGRAAMAPMYYFTFWRMKYPILHKFKPDLDQSRRPTS